MTGHLVIHAWMREALGLSGGKLLLYATIYGFSQDGISSFSGTVGYLAAWSGLSERWVTATLAEWEKSGLVSVDRHAGRGGRVEVRANAAMAECPAAGRKPEPVATAYCPYVDYCEGLSRDVQNAIYECFFWRNASRPNAELSEFIRYNDSRSWRSSSGMAFSSSVQRLALAKGWKFRWGDERTDRTFLATCRQLHDLAKRCDDRAWLLLDPETSASVSDDCVKINCDDGLRCWLEQHVKNDDDIGKALARFVKSKQGRKLVYVVRNAS